MNKQKILVIEDEPEVRDIIVRTLKHFGYITLEAANGQEGIEKIVGEKPDLVIIDLVMPVMDGMQLLAWIRGNHGSVNPNIKIIVMSGYYPVPEGYDSLEQMVLDAGADAFLEKPSTAAQLNAAVEALLSPPPQTG
jgi:CheY-like chemotaxis protein